jgi:hypothetical protein
MAAGPSLPSTNIRFATAATLYPTEHCDSVSLMRERERGTTRSALTIDHICSIHAAWTLLELPQFHALFVNGSLCEHVLTCLHSVVWILSLFKVTGFTAVLIDWKSSAFCLLSALVMNLFWYGSRESCYEILHRALELFGPCEHGNETLCSIKGGEFLD